MTTQPATVDEVLGNADVAAAVDAAHQIPYDGTLSLLTLGGSRAYGTDLPGSDVDVRGVYTAEARRLLDGTGAPDSYQRDEPDLLVYETGRLFTLAAAANPNVLEVLYGPVLHADAAGRLLVAERDLLLSK